MIVYDSIILMIVMIRMMNLKKHHVYIHVSCIMCRSLHFSKKIMDFGFTRSLHKEKASQSLEAGQAENGTETEKADDAFLVPKTAGNLEEFFLN